NDLKAPCDQNVPVNVLEHSSRQPISVFLGDGGEGLESGMVKGRHVASRNELGHDAFLSGDVRRGKGLFPGHVSGKFPELLSRARVKGRAGVAFSPTTSPYIYVYILYR